jgi:hypothetical protein
MAKRYRYAFVKKKEAEEGKWSVSLAVMSLLLFAAAVTAEYFLPESCGFLVGGISIFAMMLSVYGFIMGLRSFSEEECMHRTSMTGSICCGILMVAWLVLYLMGV